jgi:hypothetical protein
MPTNDGNEPSFFARYIEGPEEERPEPERILMGRDTVLQWMRWCIDANAIKLEKENENPRAINLGSDHKPVWIATDYLYESYLSTCRQQNTWYPVNKYFFGMVLTKMLGPCCRSTAGPEDRVKIMFGQGARPRLPWGHLIPSGKTWQGMLDARLRLVHRGRSRIKPPEADQAHQRDGRIGSR